jgi:hypothetical protein
MVEMKDSEMQTLFRLSRRGLKAEKLLLELFVAVHIRQNFTKELMSEIQNFLGITEVPPENCLNEVIK